MRNDDAAHSTHARLEQQVRRSHHEVFLVVTLACVHITHAVNHVGGPCSTHTSGLGTMVRCSMGRGSGVHHQRFSSPRRWTARQTLSIWGLAVRPRRPLRPCPSSATAGGSRVTANSEHERLVWGRITARKSAMKSVAMSLLGCSGPRAVRKLFTGCLGSVAACAFAEWSWKRETRAEGIAGAQKP
jgi:hypothetical protein